MVTYKLKKIANRFIPVKGYKALIILNKVYVRRNTTLQQKDWTHEAIHSKQQKELLLVIFLLLYGLEYVVKLLCTFSFNRAYKSVSFEQEAYEKQHNLQWPYARPDYYWRKFVLTLA